MLRETVTVDSVHVLDSILIREGGDTVVRERWRTCWRERVVRDTVWRQTTDTVRLTETVEIPVEPPRKGGNAGWAAAIALLAAITIHTLIKTLLNKP